ncbi:MAG: hypothetical protein LBS84_08150 [Clostridiales bacterium]|jgi:hypothetical protein|nr:hypothetical protein [Clostridiales bacterium]
MSNYNDGNQPPSGEPQRGPNPDHPGSPWPSQGRQPEQPPWQGRQPDNPWQTPPEPRAPYTPDRPPTSGGANDWTYEHPQTTGMDTSVMSVKDWLKCYLLMLIPCASLILPFVWAFSDKGNLNRRNMFRATLIMGAISVGIYLVLLLFMAVLGMSIPYLD